jgi:peptidoglycan/LPS O-acetylase OafA/YrhL
MGYYLFSLDTTQNILEKNWKFLLVSWVILTIAFLTGGLMGHPELGFGTSPLNCLAGWMGVLALIGTGKRFINTTSSFSAYMGAASYPLYIIHMPIMLALAYYVLMLAISPAVQFAIILIGTILLTLACYEILKRIPVVRVLFGIPAPRKKTA